MWTRPGGLVLCVQGSECRTASGAVARRGDRRPAPRQAAGCSTRWPSWPAPWAFTGQRRPWGSRPERVQPRVGLVLVASFLAALLSATVAGHSLSSPRLRAQPVLKKNSWELFLLSSWLILNCQS